MKVWKRINKLIKIYLKDVAGGLRMNISSVVVRTRPEHLDNVLESLNGSEHCEVHFHDEQGRVVITVEGENVDEEVEKLKLIQNLPDVISAELVYAYSDDELTKAKKYLDKVGGPIPDALRDQ